MVRRDGLTPSAGKPREDLAQGNHRASRHDGAVAFRLVPATISLAEVGAALVGALIAGLIGAAIARYQHQLDRTAAEA
jgi:hypothetical protein